MVPLFLPGVIIPMLMLQSVINQSIFKLLKTVSTDIAVWGKFKMQKVSENDHSPG